MFGLIIGHSMKLISGFLPNAADHPLSGFNTLSFLFNYLDFREVIIEDLYLILWMVNIVMFSNYLTVFYFGPGSPVGTCLG